MSANLQQLLVARSELQTVWTSLNGIVNDPTARRHQDALLGGLETLDVMIRDRRRADEVHGQANHARGRR